MAFIPITSPAIPANRSIPADALVLALNTVKRHVTHILEKLGAANRTEAIACARSARAAP